MNKTKELENIKQIVDDLGNVEQFVQDPKILNKITAEINNLKKMYAIELEGPGSDESVEAADIAIPIFPWFDFNVSGHYNYSSPWFKIDAPIRIKPELDGMLEASIPNIPIPIPGIPVPKIPVQKIPFPHTPIFFYSENLRLDVDGRYPQMAASGNILSLFSNVHWIASLTKKEANKWEGDIWYKRGTTAFFKYTKLTITTVRSIFHANRSATLVFSGPGLTNRTITLKFKSTYAHNVEFEFDYEDGITPVTAIQTHAHNNRPFTLPNENLSIDTVFRRAGFNVTHTSGAGSVPSALKGGNGRWSDNEMHDAMQTYWSKFANIPQWSLWTFFAKQHDQGSSLGGIMFDDIGPNHRQGTAIFYDSFIANAPSYDTNKPAWVNRMMFWTAVHEMGHAFNLAHSWQKEYPYLGNPWLPSLADEPEARSFMNYPYNVSGGESAFFSDFEFRFSDQELLFMRHAPAEFVQMGNANWFDNHGFEWAKTAKEPALQLEARVHRPKMEFEFMEPVNVELKLKNVSAYPEVVDETVLKDMHETTIVIKRNDDPAKQYFPFAVRCYNGGKKVLNPGEALYDSVFLSAGKKGWIITEPGYYSIQICMRHKEEDIVSNMLRIRVNPPKGYDESYVAQDYFVDDVSRVLAFNGSLFLNNANDILHEVSDKLKDSRVAYHANIALAAPLSTDYKLLNFKAIEEQHLTSVADADGQIKVVKAKNKEANKLYEKSIEKNARDEKALVRNMYEAVETIGHIDSKKVMDDYTQSLLKEGKEKEAIQVQESLLKVYESKEVIKSVRENIKQKIKEIKK